MSFTEIIAFLFEFTFYYPLFMAYLWIVGGLYYYLHWERGTTSSYKQPPVLSEYPPVSVIVPCFNEGKHLKEIVQALCRIEYPDYEIILVDDGSTDNTTSILNQLPYQTNLRVMRHAENQGKAVALHTGTLVAKNEFLVCIDGDTILDPHAVHWMVRHFISGPRVGAVTGNPRIRNRSTLLGKIQVGEFSSIIGLIKRAQRVYGRIFTVSGVITAFRKTALHQVGYWSSDMVTEDIDISWKLQLDHWDIRYEPNSLCWILAPETLHGLWRQRLRWAQGGIEVLIKHFMEMTPWRKRRMWVIWLESLVSVLWSYLMFTVLCIWLLNFIVELPEEIVVSSIAPGWTGVLLGFTCLLQFGISLLIDNQYEPRIWHYYYWMIWYPILYWLLSAATVIVAVPTVLLKRKKTRARWISPDRGLQELDDSHA